METKQERYRKTGKYVISRLKSQQKRKERYATDSIYHEHIRELKRQSSKRTSQKCVERAKKWALQNPEKVLKIRIKSHSKGANQFNISVPRYKWALHSWSQTIRQNSNNKCQICGNPSNEVHHLFYKSFYPELSLNLNNGIALCYTHHYEVHGKVS